jgi:hypothetical protein
VREREREREGEGEGEGETQYQQINLSSDFHKILYRSSLQQSLSMHECHANKISDSYISLQNTHFFYLSTPAFMADLGEGECRNLHAMPNNNYEFC